MFFTIFSYREFSTLFTLLPSVSVGMVGKYIGSPKTILIYSVPRLKYCKARPRRVAKK